MYTHATIQHTCSTVYAATKAYLSSFSQALHSELQPYGVGVTCVQPGATETAFAANNNAKGVRAFKYPGMQMQPQQVARISVVSSKQSSLEVLCTETFAETL
jgi:uncharacterized protein